MVSIKHNNTVLIHDGTWTERERESKLEWQAMITGPGILLALLTGWLAVDTTQQAIIVSTEKGRADVTPPHPLPRVLSRGRLYGMVSQLIGLLLDGGRTGLGTP